MSKQEQLTDEEIQILADRYEKLYERFRKGTSDPSAAAMMVMAFQIGRLEDQLVRIERALHDESGFQK